MGRRAIEEEIGHAIRTCDAVLLACTCFPLVSDLIRELNPHCLLLDPGIGTSDVLPRTPSSQTNRLTLAVSGDALSAADVSRHATDLFNGWEIEHVIGMPPLDKALTSSCVTHDTGS